MIDFSRRDMVDAFAVAAGVYSPEPVERAKVRRVGGRDYWAHPGHLEVLGALEKGERKILPVCGVRWGKTLLDAFLAFFGAMQPGKNIWIVSPTYELGEKAWFYLIEMLDRAGFGSNYRTNRRRKRLEFPWGTFAQLKSADKPDSLASEECDLIIGEEFAKSKPRTWMRLRSRLIDRRGQIILPSTPEGFNHYYDLFASETFWTLQSASQVNPWLLLEELESMRADMGRSEYAQEVEAQFTAMTGAVFAEFSRERHVLKAPDIDNWPVTVVVDPGLNDPCAITWIAHHPEGRDVVFRSMRLREQAAAFPNVLKQIRTHEPRGGYEAYVYDPWGGDARSQETMHSFRSWMKQNGGLNFTAFKMAKRARILAVRSRLENMKGEARLFFADAPECRSIIQAVSSWHYPEGEKQADPVHDINSHECDNLCNYVAWRYKRGKNRGWVA